MELLVRPAHVAMACRPYSRGPAPLFPHAGSEVGAAHRSDIDLFFSRVFRTLPLVHLPGCITLGLISALSHTRRLHPPPHSSPSTLSLLLGAHGDRPRRHGDGRDSLPRGAQLLLHQPGSGHCVHRAVHHPHRGGHHRLAAPRRRLGTVMGGRAGEGGWTGGRWAGSDLPSWLISLDGWEKLKSPLDTHINLLMHLGGALGVPRQASQTHTHSHWLMSQGNNGPKSSQSHQVFENAKHKIQVQVLQLVSHLL